MGCRVASVATMGRSNCMSGVCLYPLDQGDMAPDAEYDQ